MPQLIPDRIDLTKIQIEITDQAGLGFSDLRLTIRCTWDDGVAATVCSTLVEHGALGDLPDEIRDVLDGFIWGEPRAEAVMHHVDRLDQSAQSRKVRQAHRGR